MKPDKVQSAAETKFRRNVICVGAAHLFVIGGLVGGAAWLEGRVTAPEPIHWLDPGSFGGSASAASVAVAPTPEASRERGSVPAMTPPEDAEAASTVAPETSLTPRADEFSTVKPTPTPTPSPTPPPKPKPTPPAFTKASPIPKTIRKPLSSPAPTPREAKKVSPTPTPKPKPTPEPTAVLAKNEASPKKTPPPALGRKAAAVNPTVPKTDSSEELAARKAAIADAINSAGGTGGSSASGGSGTSGSVRTQGGGSGNTATILGVYNDMIHDRFYSEWDQPTVAGGVPAGTMGVLLKIRVEKDGTISKSSLSSASGLPAMDNSVLAVPAKVGKIEPPPLEVLGKRPFYEVSIKFARE